MTLKKIPMRTRLLALSLLLAAQTCAAGELYRIVGPDGKVSYSDRPQVTPGATASVKAVKVPGMSSKPSVDYTAAEAVSRVLAMEGVVQHLTRFCGKHVSKSSPAVREARDAWLVRNASLSQQGNKVGRDLMTAGQLQQLAYAIDDESKRIEGMANQATLAMKTTWCADAPANFTAREMDPSRDLALARVLMGYKFTKQ